MATRQNGYNTHLYESQFGYVVSKFNIQQASDDLGTYFPSSGKDEVALRFLGYSYVNGTTANNAKLLLNLSAPNKVARTIQVKIDIGVPILLSRFRAQRVLVKNLFHLEPALAQPRLK